MKNIFFLSIFPEVFKEYCNASILARAQEKGLVKFSYINIRDYSTNKHQTVDDTPYGGGAGMVMQVEPIYKAIKDVTKDLAGKTKIILMAAAGKQFDQTKAQELQDNYDNLIFICGRYEGVDERVIEYIADEEISIGPYVLTGGELPAIIIADAVIRLIPEALGNQESLEGESHTSDGLLAFPQYSKPPHFKPDDSEDTWDVPEILQSGNHGAIAKWREEHRK